MRGWRSIAVYLSFGSLLARAAAPAAPPRVMFWAWETPTKLRGLPPEAGVAFLAATVRLSPAYRTSAVQPRLQPLWISPGTYRMAVVRLESRPAPGRVLSAEQRRVAVNAILDTVRVVKAPAVQIDFDARPSEREFFTALVREVRAGLDAKIFLSVTALVWWCDSGGRGDWLNALAADEVVPMTFEMGPGGAYAEARLRSGGQLANPRCRDSMGISADDAAVRPRPRTRVNVFSYGDWTPDSVASILKKFR